MNILSKKTIILLQIVILVFIIILIKKHFIDNCFLKKGSVKKISSIKKDNFSNFQIEPFTTNNFLRQYNTLTDKNTYVVKISEDLIDKIKSIVSNHSDKDVSTVFFDVNTKDKIFYESFGFNSIDITTNEPTDIFKMIGSKSSFNIKFYPYYFNFKSIVGSFDDNTDINSIFTNSENLNTDLYMYVEPKYLFVEEELNNKEFLESIGSSILCYVTISRNCILEYISTKEPDFINNSFKDKSIRDVNNFFIPIKQDLIKDKDGSSIYNFKSFVDIQTSINNSQLCNKHNNLYLPNYNNILKLSLSKKILYKSIYTYVEDNNKIIFIRNKENDAKFIYGSVYIIDIPSYKKKYYLDKNTNKLEELTENTAPSSMINLEAPLIVYPLKQNIDVDISLDPIIMIQPKNIIIDTRDTVHILNTNIEKLNKFSNKLDVETENLINNANKSNDQKIKLKETIKDQAFRGLEEVYQQTSNKILSNLANGLLI